MGKVIFLNEKAKQFHEENGIKVEIEKSHLKLVHSVEDLATKRKRSKRKTLGQRIYENLQNNKNEPPDDAS